MARDFIRLANCERALWRLNGVCNVSQDESEPDTENLEDQQELLQAGCSQSADPPLNLEDEEETLCWYASMCARYEHRQPGDYSEWNDMHRWDALHENQRRKIARLKGVPGVPDCDIEPIVMTPELYEMIDDDEEEKRTGVDCTDIGPAQKRTKFH
jgi:hypothetical protein